MGCNTQIMKIGSTKLFYIFRRALGIFCLLLMFNNGFAQIYENGKEIVFATGDLKSESTIFYVSEGTHVHSVQKPESSQKKKAVKNVNKILSAKNTKNNSKKHLIAAKNKAKPIIRYHCSLADNNRILYASQLSKNVFAGNFHDYHSKFFANAAFCYSTKSDSFLTSKIVIKTVKDRLQYFFEDFKVRPPPVFSEAQTILKC